MNYRPKVVRCRLKTGGKSIPQIREECRGQGLTYRDFENIQRSNEEFDGLVVLLSLWAYDNHASYHLHNWDPADDERMMMAIYYAEQVHPFPVLQANMRLVCSGFVLLFLCQVQVFTIIAVFHFLPLRKYSRTNAI